MVYVILCEHPLGSMTPLQESSDLIGARYIPCCGNLIGAAI